MLKQKRQILTFIRNSSYPFILPYEWIKIKSWDSLMAQTVKKIN